MYYINIKKYKHLIDIITALITLYIYIYILDLIELYNIEIRSYLWQVICMHRNGNRIDILNINVINTFIAYKQAQLLHFSVNIEKYQTSRKVKNFIWHK